jgi:hypothetical protein
MAALRAYAYAMAWVCPDRTSTTTRLPPSAGLPTTWSRSAASSAYDTKVFHASGLACLLDGAAHERDRTPSGDHSQLDADDYLHWIRNTQGADSATTPRRIYENGEGHA